MRNNNQSLDMFVLIGVGLALWELYIAYKNQKDTVEQTKLIKKGFNLDKEV